MKGLLSIVVVLCCVAILVEGHGYLLKPPARGTAWRQGFKTPADYNDMAMYCGGKGVQHNQRNGGKCGVCGEEYTSTSKKVEPGPSNKFATGTIVGNYNQGETIDVTVHATAFHKGYYEFRLCENNVPQKGKDSSIAVSVECLDRNLLVNAKTGGTTFHATPLKSTHQVKLPAGVSCSACVLQWRYRTGNSWGCENGKCGLGFGPQEEFYGCSDIAIKPSGGRAPVAPVAPVVRKPAPQIYRPTTQRPTTQRPTYRQPVTRPTVKTFVQKAVVNNPVVNNPVPQTGRKVCRGVAPYGSSVDNYCRINCNHVVPFCPPSHCACQ